MDDSIGGSRWAWRGALALVAVFIAGFAGGIAAERYVLAHPALTQFAEGERGRREGREPGAGGWREPAARDPNERRSGETGVPTHMFRLNLTPAQETTLIEIARRRRPAAESLMMSLRPAVRNIENQMMQEMLCALTPEQQTHWLAYMDSAHFEPAIVAERYRPVRTGTCAETRR